MNDNRKQDSADNGVGSTGGSAPRPPRRAIIAIRNPWLRVPLAIVAAPLALVICGLTGLVRGLDEAGDTIYGAIRGERKQ